MATEEREERAESESRMEGYHDENYGIDHEQVEDEILSEIPKEVRKRLWWRNAVINMVFIAIWFVIAIVLTVYNRWMFSEERYGFSWPLFVTTLHFFIQFGYAALVRNIWPAIFRPEYNPSPKHYGQRVVPTAVATCLDIGLSNYSLKIISVAFMTMCKSSSLIFVLFFAFLFRLEAVSLRLIGVILLICIGVFMMVAAETEFNLLGFVLITSASALSGLRWSLTHLLLKNREMGMNNPAATIFWLAPVMGLTLAIISFALESWKSIFSSKFFDSVGHACTTALFLILPGTMAFCMVLTEYTIIQRAGVIPMSIAGIAKEVTQILVSTWLFGDERLTPLNLIGVGVTVCGISLYTYHKYHKSVDMDRPLETQNYEILSEEAESLLELDERRRHASPIEAGTDARIIEEIRKDSYVHNENSHSQILFDAESIDGTGPVAVLAHRPDTVVLSDPPGSVHETSKLARVANVENNATQRTELP